MRQFLDSAKRLWRARRPIAGSVVIAFVDRPEITPERLGAALAAQLAEAIRAALRKRKEPTLLQIHVECVERAEQLIRAK